MMLALILGVGGVGAGVTAWGAARGGRAARGGALVGTAALLAVLVVSLASSAPGTDSLTSSAGVPGSLFGGGLVVTGYLRLIIALWALDAAIVIGLAWLIGGLNALRGLLAGTLGAIVVATIALGATDLSLGVVAGAGTGLTAAIIVLASDRASAIPAVARELQVSLIAGALLLGAMAVAPVAAALMLASGTGGAGGDGLFASPGGEAGAVIGLVALVITLGVALRMGSIPFHVRVARVTDVITPAGVPLLIAWLPLPLAVAGLNVIDHLVTPMALPLEGERGIILALAVLTLGAAALAAFIQDDLRHAVGYLVIADGGLVLLGFAALDPGAWGPTRVWLVALAASKTALAAWSAVAEARFETRSLPDLRGWVRRSPILAAAFLVTTVATFGLPGWIVFDARGELARLAVGGPWDAALILAGFLTLPAYLRILSIGLGPASSRVDRASPERITRSWRRRETLAVEVEGTPAAGGTTGAGEALQTTTAIVGAPLATSAATARRARRGGAGGSVGRRLGNAVRRDRIELTSAAVLSLAILAALTSWGALNIGAAAGEPAPIVSGPSSD